MSNPQIVADPNQSFLNKLVFGQKYNVPVASQEVPFGPGNIGKTIKAGESLAKELQSLVNRLGKLRGTVTAKEASQIAREAQTYPGNAAAPARPVPPRPQRIVGPKPGPVTLTKAEPVGPRAVLAARMNNKTDLWNSLKNVKQPIKPEPVPSVVSEDIQAIVARGKRIQAEIAADIENPMQRSSGFPGIDLRSAQAKAPIPKAQQQQASLKYGIQEALKHEEPLPGIYRWREDQAIAEMQTKQRADLAADAEQRYAEAVARQDWIEARLSQIRAEVSRIQGRMTGEVKPPQYLEQVTSDYPSQIAQTQQAEARVQTGLKEADAAERARAQAMRTRKR